MQTGRPKKQQRASRACDLCHRRSIRCRPSVEDPTSRCQNCHDFDVQCAYLRPSRRGNVQERIVREEDLGAALERCKIEADTSSGTTTARDQTVEQHQRLKPLTSPHQSIAGCMSGKGVLETWRPFALASLDAIDRLLHTYAKVFYPIYPLFHWPSFQERVGKRDFLTDRGLFASVMGACALVRAHELTTAGHVSSTLPESLRGPETESYFLAASGVILQELANARSLHHLRASGLLALAAFHRGQITQMHEYLGRFWTLSSADGFADESQWPQDITLIETEERRRLFWSIYSLDVLASIVYVKPTLVEDTNVRVRYPQELDDLRITDHSYVSSVEPSWFKGWNFVVDLTRALANNLIHYRRRHYSTHSSGLACLRQHTPILADSDSLVVNTMAYYHRMPSQFKKNTPPAMTTDFAADLIGIQAIRIRVGVQLLCASACLSHDGLDIDKKFDCAEELLSLIHDVDDQLSRVAMIPFAHHLIAVVQCFANDVEMLKTISQRQRMLSMLGRMEVLLSGFETLRCRATELLRGQRDSKRYLAATPRE